MALDMEAKAIICLTASGRAMNLIAKYRPPMATYIVSPDTAVAGACRAVFGLMSICMDFEGQAPKEVTRRVVEYINAVGGAPPLRDGDQLVVVHRRTMEMGNVLDDQRLAARLMIVGDHDTVEIPYKAGLQGESTVICRSTKIGLDTLLDADKFKHIVRKTKILCTLGPKCTSVEMLGKLIDAGMNVARFNFSHGDHASHKEVRLLTASFHFLEAGQRGATCASRRSSLRTRAHVSSRVDLSAAVLRCPGNDCDNLAGAGPVQAAAHREGISVSHAAGHQGT